MHKIKYNLYNQSNSYKRVKGFYLTSEKITKNSGAKCYIIPCQKNSTYRIKRNRKSNRSVVGVTREYPRVDVDIIVSSTFFASVNEVDVSTRDGNYIVIYYEVNTEESDAVDWEVIKLNNLINIFSGFELGDYDSQNGNAKDNDRRIRSVSEEKVLIDSGTYTIDFKDKLTIGIRLYDINEKFYTFAYQNNGSGKLTFNVNKQSYIKLIAETTNTNRKAYLTRG